MRKEEKVCPKCGKRMSLVAAGLYCMKDDCLMDPVTGKPIERSFVPSIGRGGPEMALKARPSEITLVVILGVIGGVLELFAGLALLFVSAFLIGFLPTGVPFVPGLVFGFLTLIAGLLVVIAVIDFLAAWGLWTSRRWAWIVALVLAVLRVIGGLAALPMGIIGIIVQGLVIYFLTRPHVRAFFGREAPPTPTPPAEGPI